MAWCWLWSLQEYIWGDEDSVWTEMVRGKDIDMANVTAPVFGKMSWEEIDYPTGDAKHQAVTSPKATVHFPGSAGLVDTSEESLHYFHYRSGDGPGK